MSSPAFQVDEHGHRVRGLFFCLTCRLLSKVIEVRLEQDVYETPMQRMEAYWYEAYLRSARTQAACCAELPDTAN